MSSILECILEGFCSCLYWCCMEMCCSERGQVPEQRRTIPKVTESQPNGHPVFIDAIGVATEPSNDIRESIDKYDDRLYGIR